MQARNGKSELNISLKQKPPMKAMKLIPIRVLRLVMCSNLEHDADEKMEREREKKEKEEINTLPGRT